MRLKKRKKRAVGACRCGRRAPYRLCCGPLHEGEAALDPVALMRSRYVAYAKGLTDYIIETTDREGPAWEGDLDEWRVRIAEFSQSTKFLGVTILDSGVDGDVGRVTFRAELERAGEDVSFTESSRFVRREGRWLYAASEGQA